MINSFFTNIGKVLAIPLIAILSSAGVNLNPTIPTIPSNLATTNYVQDLVNEKTSSIVKGFSPTGSGTIRLQSSIGVSDTTINLSSFVEPISGIPYTMSYLGSTVEYATLDPQQPTRSEFISFTGITQRTNGTAQLTGVVRGLSRTPGVTGCVASTTLAQSHSGQSIMILSNSPCFYSEYAVKRNDEVITGLWTVPDPISAQGIATMNYVVGKAFGGIGNASETATGTVEIATGAEAAASTQNGTKGRLALPASLATSTYNSATAVNVIPVTGATGKIDSNFISTSAVFANFFKFGDGHDGDVTVSAPLTLTRDMYYNNLVVNSTITENGYRVFVKGTLSGSGSIRWGVANAGSNGLGTTGGAGGTAAAYTNNGGLFRLNMAGGAGANTNSEGNNAPNSATSTCGTRGGQGGHEHARIGGSPGATSTPYIACGVFSFNTFNNLEMSSTTFSTFTAYEAGTGGGGASAGNPGAGGGGGASCGATFVAANIETGTFTIGCPGGNGGNGAGSDDAGGGGGGAGGTVYNIYSDKSGWAGSYNNLGGAGGAGNLSGTTGSTGTTGATYDLPIGNLL
jgi:hypothetical protein